MSPLRVQKKVKMTRGMAEMENTTSVGGWLEGLGGKVVGVQGEKNIYPTEG